MLDSDLITYFTPLLNPCKRYSELAKVWTRVHVWVFGQDERIGMYPFGIWHFLGGLPPHQSRGHAAN